MKTRWIERIEHVTLDKTGVPIPKLFDNIVDKDYTKPSNSQGKTKQVFATIGTPNIKKKICPCFTLLEMKYPLWIYRHVILISD